MKTLLITYYWYPYNNSGTFRWANFGRYMNFDVLTCSRPLRSFKDFTIDTPNKYDNVKKFGYRLPAIVWGFFAPFIALFRKYDVYVFTSPPESMLIGAWIMQLIGKTVVIDMRDSIDREKQYFKSLVWLYRWFYNRMKNVVVCYQFLDEKKPVIYSGYEKLGMIPIHNIKYYSERVNYKLYMYRLRNAQMPEQSNKCEGYGSGSFQTYRFNRLPLPKGLHQELYTHKLHSIEQSANKYNEYLNSTQNRNR